MIEIDSKAMVKKLNRLSGAIKRTKDEANKLAKVKGGQFPRQAAETFALRLKENISRKTYGDFGVTYNEEYEKWKEKMFGSNTPWLLWRNVFKNIEAYRSGDGWSAGLKNLQATPYVEYVERDRPLFEYTFDEFKYKDWPILMWEVRRKMSQAFKFGLKK